MGMKWLSKCALHCNFQILKLFGSLLTARVVQPVDQGIGNSLNARYRQSLHDHMARNIQFNRDAQDGIDLLDTCIWLGRAWNSLNKTQTVVKCFEKAVFHPDLQTPTKDCEIANDDDEGELLSVGAEVTNAPPLGENDMMVLVTPERS